MDVDGVPRSRTRAMAVIGIGILCLFVILLAAGTLPRIRDSRALSVAAKNVRNAITKVYLLRPVQATEAGLSLAATTQAIQDTVIFARATGYVRARYVDIGDNVKQGQLLAYIESPDLDQQLQQARADLQQSEKQLE